jgi:hypothetical protein
MSSSTNIMHGMSVIAWIMSLVNSSLETRLENWMYAEVPK